MTSDNHYLNHTTTAGNNDGQQMGWHFDNSYLNLPNGLYTLVKPTPVTAPDLVLFNETLAATLGLNAAALNTPEGAAIFSGNQLPSGTASLAQAYAGHQFGHFVLLGDGRAVLLGEHMTPIGKRFDIQLKGSGTTPYSRRGDGRAALGPMLREYLISEAMNALGIPTSRSLAVVTTGEPVLRETQLEGAVLTRVAASHIRVGTFQYAAARLSQEDLRSLADYTIQRHYPEISSSDEPYLCLLQSVIHQQASLVAQWMLAGFIHGVMNTDNMAISGETIDYGPCAFMDTYHPGTVFSSIDHGGRYAYGNQPSIAGWNLARFAETLLPLLHLKKETAITTAQGALEKYASVYQQHWLRGMRSKLGLFNEEDQDESLITRLLSLVETHKEDYTNTFVALTHDKTTETSLSTQPGFSDWLAAWQARRKRQPYLINDSQALMHQSNPAVIPRNHHVEQVLEAAVHHHDFQGFHRFLEALSQPYAHTSSQQTYADPPPPSFKRYRTFCGT
ncbi:protein adenylyltransferase SelO [Anoxynatronum buryatiense]|uniref:Protein nucleotidyltransferase YdiU n=1 Tax=Anoxynatronum buryatiense TaxID=489973 RepID=A0AA45WSX1_9CLOT|nr:YdiU family protein [Anoxynatronum buryatiense]SMP38607.1 Uncharacterized conserved protein YdiU, UPF0061 family [Anoxynatronum buryatiense]